jgi:hypothetical protein
MVDQHGMRKVIRSRTGAACMTTHHHIFADSAQACCARRTTMVNGVLETERSGTYYFATKPGLFAA